MARRVDSPDTNDEITTHPATLLANDKVLVTGGYNSSQVLTNAELYDLATGNWTAIICKANLN